jgi:diguanylate cyclase (GGDEF)-like protein
LNKGALLQKIDDYYFTKDRNNPCAMCVIDLDDFKLVNDNLGHSAGDLLLERLGKLLLDSFRAYDIIGRYGGDEFVVFMPNMDDADILQMRCRSLQMLLTDFYLGNGKPFSVSIGAIIDEGNHSKEELFMMADDALYKAKLDGKNCYTTWTVKEQEYSNKPLLIAIPGEDNKGVVKMLRGEQDRFDIKSAGTGNEALRVISQYHSDIRIIILEMNIPDKDSEQILRYIKSREGFSNLPIIAVADTKENSNIAKVLGADEVLMFDSPDEEYKAAINRLVRM